MLINGEQTEVFKLDSFDSIEFEEESQSKIYELKMTNPQLYVKYTRKYGESIFPHLPNVLQHELITLETMPLPVPVGESAIEESFFRRKGNSLWESNGINHKIRYVIGKSTEKDGVKYFLGYSPLEILTTAFPFQQFLEINPKIRQSLRELPEYVSEIINTALKNNSGPLKLK